MNISSILNNKLLLILLSVLAVFGVYSTVFAPVISAQSGQQEICTAAGGTWNSADGGTCTAAGEQDVSGLFETVANVLIFIVGGVSVIVLIIAGLRFVVSGSDPNAVASARNQILYAIVGIVVAASAYGIVRFVVNVL